jgi:hypothetical protein
VIQFSKPHSPGCPCGDCWQDWRQPAIAADPDFYAACPVCTLGQLRVRYHYEHAQAWAGDPVIMDQDCTCLLGQEAADSLLDDYLDRR